MKDEPPVARLIRDPQTPLDKIVANWIRWLPASIFFFGFAFVTWTIVMIVQVGRYHDAVTKMDQRVKVLEQELKDTKEQNQGLYYARECVSDWGVNLWKEHERSCHRVDP
jgi:hypothetical protein